MKNISKIIQYLNIGNKPGKIPELDGLRACAILMVLFYHFGTTYQEVAGSYYRAIISEFFNRLMHNGWLGVDLFFVLSGYLIFKSLIKIQEENSRVQSYGRYALKRILRTFPLYYAIIALYVLVIASSHTDRLSFTDFWIHFIFIQDYFGANILSPLWSLATEEKFYLLAPLMLFVLKRFSVGQVITSLLALMLIITIIKTAGVYGHEGKFSFNKFFLQYRAPFHYAMVSIGVGVVVAYMEQIKLPKWFPALGFVSIIAIVLILCFVDLYYPEQWHWIGVWHFITVILFGILMLTVIKQSGGPWVQILRGRFLRVIAVLSYSLYLSHMAILPWLYKLHKYWIRSEEAWVHSLTFFIMYIGLSLALALILHYLVEKPFLIIKDRL